MDAEITAQMPAPVAVATLLLRLLDTLEQNVDGVIRDIDTEFLHDLRVSVRRTRSAIKLLGDVLPAGLAEQYGPEFKWLGDLTTPTRDLDVHLLGLPAMAEHLLAASPEDLEPFRAFLARRRTREFKALATVMRSARFRTLTDHWRKALVEVRDAATPRKRRQAHRLTAAELAISRTARVFRRVAAQGGAITPDSAPESLHDLRKRCKELRYLLEFFAPLYDPVAYKKVVGRPQATPGLPRRVPGQRGTAGGNPGPGRRDARRSRGPRRYAAGHGRNRRKAGAQPGRGPGRLQPALRQVRGPRGPAARPHPPRRSRSRSQHPVKIYATYNIKGGVGKTTAAVNLAYLSAEQGQRTLLWDLDPQGAASQ